MIGRRPAPPYLRVTWRGYWIADCRSVAEVARYVDLASLTEEGSPWRQEDSVPAGGHVAQAERLAG